ncbi:MAG TPA: hypothetical protein VKU44_07510, partial [Terriglobia bacterium]|nr:hypothetical protein [Terriglobia bacterium]
MPAPDPMEEQPINIIRQLLRVARPYAGRLLLVAMLTSLGALGELVEPWVYRAIINDIAGVFVSRASGIWPEILEELRSGGVEDEPDATVPPAGPSGAAPAPASPHEEHAESSTPAGSTPATAATSPQTSPPTGGSTTANQGNGAPLAQTPAAEPAKPRSRRASARARAKPASRSRLHNLQTQVTQGLKQVAEQPTTPPSLPPRTVSHAMRTLWVGVLVLLVAIVLAKLFTAAADLLVASTTNDMEENFILRTFRHVLRLPFSYFTQRPSGTVARQIDQSDQMAPLYAAITQEVWSEVFTAAAIIVVMLSVNLQ